ncbi:MAG: VOC family protein [Gammaproteobacteria bacterium]
MTGRSHVLRLRRIGRNVSDLARAIAFHRDALGFSLINETRIDDPAWGELMGIPNVRVHAATLRLGEQEIELTAFDPPGRAYPPESGSTDLWFQHLAIVVANMDVAYARLCRHVFTAITEGDPQQLPPNTGSVTAFKFRDPDGHPLELLYFPPGTGDACWQPKQCVFLGIDHSAITVADAAESIDFYTRLLGLHVAARSINSGAEQARLDHAPDVRVNVVALEPAEAHTPHVELLGYERPAGRPFPAGIKPNDILADRLVLEVDDLPRLVQVLEAENLMFVSPDMVTANDGRRVALVHDPTGHLLLFTQADRTQSAVTS